jgi:hypothetical protein
MLVNLLRTIRAVHYVYRCIMFLANCRTNSLNKEISILSHDNKHYNPPRNQNIINQIDNVSTLKLLQQIHNLIRLSDCTVTKFGKLKKGPLSFVLTS